LIEIYRKLRPGDPPTLDTAPRSSRACSSIRASTTSRASAASSSNIKLYENQEATGLDQERTPHPRGLLRDQFRYLLKLRKNIGVVDDIRPSSANRRVARCRRADGENQFRIGLVRMERAIKEKMSRSTRRCRRPLPHDLINAKPVMAAIRRVLRLLPALASSWTRPTRSAKSPTSAASRPLGLGVFLASAPAL